MSILLGFEVGTGFPVNMEVHHTAVFGMTQLSGKTTTLEAIIVRSGLKAVAFITKRGESGFAHCYPTQPHYRPRSDWQFVEGLINVALNERVKFEPGMRSAIMEACRKGKGLHDVRDASINLTKTTKSAFMRSVFERLTAYLDIVVPELQRWTFSTELLLHQGVNAMDLSAMRLETQHIVIASTLEYIAQNLNDTIAVIPEAWETLPQSKMTPVKWVAQQFIRKGASVGNFMFLDSQDIGGIDKTPLRQCDNWLMGRMREAHEVERVLKQLLGAKVKAEDIQTLPLGHFYAVLGDAVKKVYVLPAGVSPQLGGAVARGTVPVEDVRDQYMKKVDRNVDSRAVTETLSKIGQHVSDALLRERIEALWKEVIELER